MVVPSRPRYVPHSDSLTPFLPLFPIRSLSRILYRLWFQSFRGSYIGRHHIRRIVVIELPHARCHIVAIDEISSHTFVVSSSFLLVFVYDWLHTRGNSGSLGRPSCVPLPSRRARMYGHSVRCRLERLSSFCGAGTSKSSPRWSCGGELDVGGAYG